MPLKAASLNKENYIAGFDYLRVLMSLFVVLWHLDGTDRSLLFFPGRVADHQFVFSDFLNFHLLLLAVPVFILISNFLYARKELSSSNLKKILLRLIILYTFWPVAFTIFKFGHEGLSVFKPKTFEELLITLSSAGGTVYYFFASLLLTSLLTHLLSIFRTEIILTGLILSVLILFLVPAASIHYKLFRFSAYWNPVNFLPYPFAAVLLVRKFNFIRRQGVFFSLGALILCICFAVVEWKYYRSEVFFPGQGISFPAYTRASLLFGSLTLLIPALSSRIKTFGIIRLLSGYSLTLYCLHPFFFKMVDPFIKEKTSIEHPSPYLTIIPVILLSYLFGALLKRYYLQEKVIS